MARKYLGVAATLTSHLLVNKPRVVTTNAPGATPSINTDTTDVAVFTGLGTAITSMSTNLTGTAVTGQRLWVWFKDNGTARAIAFGASWGSSGTANLLATTVINKNHITAYIYDGSKWICVAADVTGY